MQEQNMQTMENEQMAPVLTQPIGEAQVRQAFATLQKYKAGKANLEARVTASENWWRLKSWRQIQKGNPMDDKWASAWLFNVIMGKHADAVAAYPAPAVRPNRTTGEKQSGSRPSCR